MVQPRVVQNRHVTWSEAIQRGLVSGSVASVTSAAALVACGKLELDDPAAPLNGPSQWLWGKQAAQADGFSVRHTLAGYIVHHAMSIFWAVLFEKYRHAPLRVAAVALPAAATSATACVIDTCLTPDRLTPGFERRLSRRSLAVVYAAFAAGLAAAAIARARLSSS
jgi:hypothetical protein